ncbi:heterokaryon incompatibility protein-domain-containing protein [Xylariomycetidae sp. FL2044]|nr:heterokaryon incompatibility protein-domain-containing protein [Xylariomycetidae sp. FL2044]
MSSNTLVKLPLDIIATEKTAVMDQYRPLDISKSEIRLLSFDDTTEYGPIRLKLHYVSLNDWKSEYTVFRDQNTSISRSKLTETWFDQARLTLVTPLNEIHDSLARFTWGDYTCLSYTWGDNADEEVSLVLDGSTVPVRKHLAAALRDLRSSFEGMIGLKFWVDALCINQADVSDRNAHVLRIKNIFGKAYSVAIWTKENDDLHFTGLSEPGDRLDFCEDVLGKYGKRVLEELLGLQQRDWGAEEDEDYALQMLAGDLHERTFDDSSWVGSDDSCGPASHLRDLVLCEMDLILGKEYWSRLWTIQELAVSPTTSMVYWANQRTIRLSTLQTIAGIFLDRLSPVDIHPAAWESLQLGFDRLAFASIWTELEDTASAGDLSMDSTSMPKLKYLAERASCSLTQDKVYGVLALFPPSVFNAVTISYNREPAEVITNFCAVVPDWITNTPLPERSQFNLGSNKGKGKEEGKEEGMEEGKEEGKEGKIPRWKGMEEQRKTILNSASREKVLKWLSA